MAVPRNALRVFALSLAVTAALYVLPFGRVLAWPLILISTLAHELGHGLAAALLGGRFEALAIYSDASGVAIWRGAFSRAAVATVAAAGLVGPAVASFVLLAGGRTERGARVLLTALGLLLVIVTLLLVRNPFGFFFTLLLSGVFLLVVLRAPRLSQTVVVLLAVQLAMAVFSRSDYLFTRVALTASGRGPSDVAVMSDALFLPYWFWGALCGVLSIALLFLGVKIFFRK